MVDAGPARTVVLPASAALDGTVSDDGRPDPPGAMTVTWSVASGPGAVTFADAGAVDTEATFTVAGSYLLRLTANDGAYRDALGLKGGHTLQYYIESSDRSIVSDPQSISF